MTDILPATTFAPAPPAYSQRDQDEVRRGIARLIDSIALGFGAGVPASRVTEGTFGAGNYVFPSTASVTSYFRARDGHFKGGISIGQLSDPYVTATRAFTGGGSLPADDYIVGITSLDEDGNESFAQEVTVTGVGANGYIEVDIVPIAGAVSYRTYLHRGTPEVPGTWTDTGDVANTFQQTLTISAMGAVTTDPPPTNATAGELLSAFVHNCTVEGGPSFFQLNLGQAVNSQSAFFFSDYYGINVSFQSRCTGSAVSPAGGKTELDIAFDGDTAQVYVGNAGTKELDFFVYGGSAFRLVQLMQSTFISNNVNVVMAPAGTADATPTNYASRLLEFQNSVWEGGAATTHYWRILNNSSNQLEIEYDAYVPIWVNATATYSRFWLRASGSVEHMLEDTTGPLNSKYIGVINDDGGLTFRFYNDNLTTKGDYLTISAAGVVSIPGGISGTVPASAVTAGTFGAGAYTFPGALAITGALTGVTTLTTSGAINGQTISSAASFTGTVNVTGNLTVDTDTLFVDAANNRVGIGTATPGQRLVVQNTSAAPYISIIAGASSAMGLLMGTTGNTVDGQIVYSNSTQAMTFVTASTVRAHIDASGNVGIGTTSPAATLDVVGTVATSGTINGQTISATANFTGTVAVASTLTVGGGIKLPVKTVNATSITITTSDHTVLADASGNVITANLPTAASASGYQFTIKKIDSSANTVTIDGNGSETIDGATTAVITMQWESVTVQSNGTAWYIL